MPEHGLFGMCHARVCRNRSCFRNSGDDGPSPGNMGSRAHCADVSASLKGGRIRSLECDQQKWSPVLRPIALYLLERVHDLIAEPLTLRRIMHWCDQQKWVSGFAADRTLVLLKECMIVSPNRSHFGGSCTGATSKSGLRFCGRSHSINAELVRN